MKVAILGSGPSAAFAHKTCMTKGIKADVYCLGRSRHPAGAFWFRKMPEGVVYNRHPIYIYPVGSEECYLEKQWGRLYSGFTSSFPEDVKVEYGYNPAQVWDALWEGANFILVGNVITDKRIKEIADQYDEVFCTFPTEESRHELSSYLVTIPIAAYKLPASLYANAVYYVGEPGQIVRLSILFGHVYTEYVSDWIVHYEAVSTATLRYHKDLHPNTPVWDANKVPANNVTLIGRYAEWNRKALSDDAIEKVTEVLDKHG